MDFVCKLYSNTYAVHVTVALVGVATLNLALPPPPGPDQGGGGKARFNVATPTYEARTRPLHVGPGGSLLHISATHLCAHTSKSVPKWRNAHHQILHP